MIIIEQDNQPRFFFVYKRKKDMSQAYNETMDYLSWKKS